MYICRQNQEQQEQLQVLSRYLLKLGLQGLALPPAVAAIVQGKDLEQGRQHAAALHASQCQEGQQHTPAHPHVCFDPCSVSLHIYSCQLVPHCSKQRAAVLFTTLTSCGLATAAVFSIPLCRACRA
jgi:hypothetical protein